MGNYVNVKKRIEPVKHDKPSLKGNMLKTRPYMLLTHFDSSPLINNEKGFLPNL